MTIPNYLNSIAGNKYQNSSFQIESYNQIIKNEAEKRGLKVVDLYNLTQDEKINQTEMFIDDGLHPAREQYSLWVDEILPNVYPLLVLPDGSN